MIVPRTEIDRLLRPGKPRTMMRLPVLRGKLKDGSSYRKRCPVSFGRAYALRPPSRYAEFKRLAERQPTRARAVLFLIDRAGAPQPETTITITAQPRREKLAAMSLEDAKREGQRDIPSAVAAWERLYGPADERTEVWVVELVKGDHSAEYFEDTPLYLSKVGDFTTAASMQAVPGDPELTFIEGEGERARLMAIAERVRPHQEVVANATLELGALKRTLLSMKARNRLRLIEHELRKLAEELPPERDLQCA